MSMSAVYRFCFVLQPKSLNLLSGHGVNSQTDCSTLSHDSMYHLLSCDLSTRAHDPMGVSGWKSPHTPTSDVVGVPSLQDPTYRCVFVKPRTLYPKIHKKNTHNTKYLKRYNSKH